MASSAVSVTLVPADCGSIIPGKSKAPQAFLDENLISKLRDTGLTASDHQALDKPARYSPQPCPAGGACNEELNVQVCEQVERQITKNLETSPSKPPFQLILGGNHAGTPSPPQRIGLIYIDADTDMNTPHDPHFVGTFAGMNMTHLLGMPGGLDSMKKFSRDGGSQPVCDATNTVFFGTNIPFAGNKPEHIEYLTTHGFQVIDASSVAGDPEQQARKALAYLEDRVDVILVHLDVDAIDPRMFPLANIPNFTGVTFDQMMRALGVMLASDKAGGLTIAEVNPDHDPGLGMIGMLTDEIVAMLGKRAGV
ncbi:hypothetical protein N7470_000425 [Penicillium chermesinum]|nr:hypothetical protein N7470_000425 [Penicillium chermesinum]